MVFAAGSNNWSFALDPMRDYADVSSPSDRNLQQAMINLFADMGNVQPSTIRAGLVLATASKDRTAPSSTVKSPAASVSLSYSAPISVTGTASDSGGVVAGVEVSADGGATWHPADGTAKWSYTFAPTKLGSITIKSRAVDDSGNLETPSAGVAITIRSTTGASGSPTAVGLMPSDAPSVSTVWNPVSAPTEVGLKFRSSVDGLVNAIRFFKDARDVGIHTGTLWRGDYDNNTNNAPNPLEPGRVIGRATFTGETASGWQTVLLAKPAAITANTAYTVSYNSQSGHRSAPGYLRSFLSNPPLSTRQGGISIATWAVMVPTNADTTYYPVDLVFRPGASVPRSLWTTDVNPVTEFSSVGSTPLELGLRFKSEATGYVTGLRFFKSSQNTGTHIGTLWDANGTKLASVSFSGESASGWQQALFASPIAVADPDGGNGVAGNIGTFPSTTTGHNYWVDVLFVTQLPVN